MMLKNAVIGTSLLALHCFQPTAAQFRFPAEAAIGTGPGTTVSGPFETNAAEKEMADPADPDAILEQPGFNAVRIFSRTCDCVRRNNNQLVRPARRHCLPNCGARRRLRACECHYEFCNIHMV